MDFLKVSLTSFFSAAALFIIAKFMGHKQMAQLDFFDYITGITIGSIAAEMATELESPWKPLVAMLVYGIITVLLTFITSKCPRMRRFINGTPTVIMSDGKFCRENMKKAKLDLSEFMVMCRQEGYFNLNDIRTAIFEFNGRLTILPKSTKRPVTPDDLKLVPKPEALNTEVIMDGRILEGNLKRLGLDREWLKTKLAAEGVKSAKEVILGLCDSDFNLIIFK